MAQWPAFDQKKGFFMKRKYHKSLYLYALVIIVTSGLTACGGPINTGTDWSGCLPVAASDQWGENTGKAQSVNINYLVRDGEARRWWKLSTGPDCTSPNIGGETIEYGSYKETATSQTGIWNLDIMVNKVERLIADSDGRYTKSTTHPSYSIYTTYKVEGKNLYLGRPTTDHDGLSQNTRSVDLYSDFLTQNGPWFGSSL